MILNNLACRLRLNCMEKFPVLNTVLIYHTVSEHFSLCGESRQCLTQGIFLCISYGLSEWAKSHFLEFFLTHCDLVCVL